MSRAVTAAGVARATDMVLAARTYPDAAVLVIALRGGHWPYSCGLASTVRHLAPRLAAGGAEVLLLAARTSHEREAIATAWRLPFRWLPETAARTVARELGAWDEASARTLDGLGLLGPDGAWILRQDLDDLGSAGSPEAVLTALTRLGLRPLPAPPPGGPALSASALSRLAAAADRPAVESTRVTVCDPGHVAGFLRRALTAADGLARSLPPSSSAAATAERTRLRLELYLRAVRDVVPASHRSPDQTAPSTAPQRHPVKEQAAP
jgi:hypothetical protein